MKRNKGITLIALIITIIVLLILVAVSVQVLIKSNLIGAAEKTTSKYKTAAEEEANGGTIEINGKKYDSIEDYVEDKDVDWEKVLEEANANPEKWRHPDQSSTNGDIGIGTDGKPVDLDLWVYIIRDGYIVLGNYTGCTNMTPGYDNGNIQEGKIIGKVPQYIRGDGNDEFYPVTNMQGTFAYCSNLVIAPVIPTTVKSMNQTFTYCTGLTKVPEIPSSVTDLHRAFYYCTNLTTAANIPSSVTRMDGTFWDCKKLQGIITINANPSIYSLFFYNAATEGSGLIVTGSSTMLDEIIATGDTSKITKGQ